MPQVQTVTGPVDASALGRTLVHEHIRVSYPGEEWDRSLAWTRADILYSAVDKLAELVDAGFRTFVDPCPIELGRDPELYAELRERGVTDDDLDIIFTDNPRRLLSGTTG